MLTWGGPGTTGETGASISTPNGPQDGLGTVLDAVREQLRTPTIDPDRELPGQVELACAGTTTRLAVPGGDPAVSTRAVDAQFRISSATELPDGEYVLSCDGSAIDPVDGGGGTVVVRFEGPASVDPRDASVAISFRDPTTVTVGRRSGAASGPSSMTVPPTPDGLATAITHVAAAHRTTGPARSHPAFRDHPPFVRIGDETRVPDAIRDATPSTDLTFRLPRSLEAAFVAAPLAYYLGARVVVEDRDRPSLVADDAAVDESFDPLPAFQHQAAQLLRRTFFLDCLVRRVAPDDGQASRDLLSAVDADLDGVADLAPAGRIERYLSLPRRDLDAILPDWHLSTYVAATNDRVRCLPHLLDRLSLVYLPRASTIDRSDLLDRTLGAAYARGGGDATGVIEPDLQAGQVHAWLAPGTPIDAFKTTPQAYENRFRYSERDHERLQVVVVLNDENMGDERDTVEDVYRRGAANLPIDVAVHDRLPRTELADLFAAEHDFVHYIGHCDDAGLRCPDGNLAVEDVAQSRTRTFFLNACGSYDQGIELIEQGSIAGAVTFQDVLDGQAARVGTAFARLLVHGFSFERALQLARRRIVMGKDYSVVGDGTYALLPSPGDPVVVWLTDGSDGGYEVTCEALDARSNGVRYRLPFEEGTLLNGATTETHLSEAELREALDGTSLPVVYRDDIHWSDELVDQL